MQVAASEQGADEAKTYVSSRGADWFVPARSSVCDVTPEKEWI
jgi:hypothetical protein